LDVKDFLHTTLAKKQEKRENDGVPDDELRQKLKQVLGVEDEGAGGPEEEDLDGEGDASFLLDEANSQVNRKCPITLKPMVQPYRNRTCKHVFEKEAVINYIRNMRDKRSKARCPNLGCTNKDLKLNDFVDVEPANPSTQEF